MQHYTITLTADATNYNVLALVRAIDAAYKDTARQIIIQSTVGNTAPIYFGNASVSATDYGNRLPLADDSINIPSGGGGAGLSNLYARAGGAAAQKLSVLVIA